jgi:hypothetical protein
MTTFRLISRRTAGIVIRPRVSWKRFHGDGEETEQERADRHDRDAAELARLEP